MEPNWVLTAIGVVIVAIAVADLYSTTLTFGGSGFLSGRVTRPIWKLLLRIHRRADNHKLLSSGGPLLLLLLFFMWFCLSWLGWFLIFSGDEMAVVQATTKTPASWIERVYFVGYTLTTVGYGDFAPEAPAWRLASTLAGLNGFFLITMSVTYFLPVISAVVEKRQIATVIASFGKSPSSLVDNSFERGEFQSLAEQLQELTWRIAGIAEKHMAYPVLHYFHPEDKNASLPVALVRLDEALSVIQHAFPELPHGNRHFRATQTVVDNFLNAIEGTMLARSTELPPLPQLDTIAALSQAQRGVDDVVYGMRSQQRRGRLLAYVREDGWGWKDVQG